ncbi:16447_t:CDS:2 [Funneliformis caledonium]|uniref:16447_t:CDS:1 n=1 Tax=Funneliformis caledonium TaxID=1117310 RepID=A0A9N8ZMD1_9GLOM|nr:16447_t:CDS:2 [Funneliformis caledonium]
MEESLHLSNDTIGQIKNFEYFSLTVEQSTLIDKLILNEGLKARYKKYGLCKECNQPKTHFNWCQSCNAKHFQQNFKNWNSGNNDINGLVQKSQLFATGYKNSDYKIPQLIFDVIKRCWDANPSNRPNANELCDSLDNLERNCNDKHSLINKQFEEADEMNKLRSTTSSDDDLSFTTHPRAYYTSRFLDFKNLSAPKIANDDNNDNPSEIEDSESVTIDFSKLRINSKVIDEKEIKDTVKD